MTIDNWRACSSIRIGFAIKVWLGVMIAIVSIGFPRAVLYISGAACGAMVRSNWNDTIGEVKCFTIQARILSTDRRSAEEDTD